MRTLAFFLILILFPASGFAQDIEEDSIQYDPVGNDLFPGYQHAKLIVDYFYTSGISLGERYKYEIIVIDDTLMLTFTSPETEDFNRVSFETKRALKKAQQISLNQVLVTAKLKQLKEGVPRPDLSGYAQQVLIVKSKTLSIGGGMFYSVVGDDSDSDLIAQKAQNSSIGGDYEGVFKVLDSFFVEKHRLLKKLYKN